MWNPHLAEGPEPLYERIADALERDIDRGALCPDERLPTHRALARSMGISVGTIAKAYQEGEARGCIVSYVGRGSFIPRRPGRAKKLAPRSLLNMARNLGPARLDPKVLARSLTA